MNDELEVEETEEVTETTSDVPTEEVTEDTSDEVESDEEETQ